MSLKLKEGKKREILEYLDKKLENNSILALNVDEIAQELADEQYSQDSIQDLIEELESEDLIETKTAKLKVAYPSNQKENIQEQYQRLFKTPIASKFIVGFLSYMFLLEWDLFYGWISSENLYPAEAYVNLGIFGIVLSFIFGTVILGAYERTRERIPMVKEYQQFVYSVGSIAIILLTVVYLSSIYLDQEIRLSHIIASITVCILGGVPLGIHLTEK